MMHTIAVITVMLFISISMVLLAFSVGDERWRTTLFRICILLGVMAILSSLSYLTDVVSVK